MTYIVLAMNSDKLVFSVVGRCPGFVAGILNQVKGNEFHVISNIQTKLRSAFLVGSVLSILDVCEKLFQIILF
jgi:hypothetical protein